MRIKDTRIINLLLASSTLIGSASAHAQILTEHNSTVPVHKSMQNNDDADLSAISSLLGAPHDYNVESTTKKAKFGRLDICTGTTLDSPSIYDPIEPSSSCADANPIAQASHPNGFPIREPLDESKKIDRSPPRQAPIARRNAPLEAQGIDALTEESIPKTAFARAIHHPLDAPTLGLPAPSNSSTGEIPVYRSPW